MKKVNEMWQNQLIYIYDYRLLFKEDNYKIKVE